MTSPAVILMAYGSPDRLADVPAYYADIRGGRPIRPGAARRPRRALRARSGSTTRTSPSPLNAVTEETRAALEESLGIRVLTGMRHWEPRIAGAVEAALERRPRRARRPRPRAALVVALDREVRGSSSTRPSRVASRRASSGSGGRTTGSWRCWPIASASRRETALRTSSSPRTRFPRGSSSPATRTATRSSRPPGSSPSAPRSATGGRSPSRASRRPASRGSAPTSSTTSTRSRPRGRRRARLPRRLRLRPSRDPVGPRRRGGAAGGELGLRFSRIEMPNADPAFVEVLAGDRPARARGRDRVDAVSTGEIQVDGVSRRFVVRARETHTLKELLVARGRTGAQEVWALRDVTLAVDARRGGRAHRTQRLGEVDAAAADRGDHQADDGPGRDRRPGRLAARARRGLPPGLHGPRERRAERDAAGADTRADPRALRRDRRVRGARARDRPARPDVLVRDDDAARLRDRGVPRGGRAPPRRGLRRRGRELPAEVLRRHRRVQGARRHDPLRLARRLGGRAAVRPRRAPARTASSRSTAPCTRRSPATGARSPRTASRPTRRVPRTPPGPARPGSRPSVSSGRTVSRARASSQASRSGSRSSSAARPRRPRSTSSFATAQGCSSPRRSSTPALLGGNGADGLSLRFDVAAPPLQFGRFDVGLALVGDDGRLAGPAPARRSPARLPRRRGARARPPRRNLAAEAKDAGR